MPPAKSGEAAPAQVDRFGGFDPRDRVRRELFTPPHRQLHIVPCVPEEESLLPMEELKYARDIPMDGRRYICDCRRCISHAVDRGHVDHPAGAPTGSDLRFVMLPELRDATSDVPGGKSWPVYCVGDQN